MPPPAKCVVYFTLEDANSVKNLFAAFKIDIIIHTATEYGRNESGSAGILNTNLILPITLLEEGIKNGAQLFINTDTYFNKPNLSYATLLDYSLSKKCLNLWLEYFSNRIKIVNLRLEHLYGDFDNSSKFCEHVIRSVAIKKEMKIKLTSGEQKRDFVYVDDVCSAYLTVLKKYDKYFFRYIQCDVGTGEAIPIKNFVKYVKEYSNSGTELRFGAIPYRDDEIMLSVADTNFLRNWGFKAKVSFQNGIEKIINIYGNKGERLK